jgi:hypothetical protein
LSTEQLLITVRANEVEGTYDHPVNFDDEFVLAEVSP